MDFLTVEELNLFLSKVDKEYYPFIKEHFRKAQKSIVGTIYLFKTAPYRDNEPADLLRELIAAPKRNVSVELVIDISSEDRDFNEANLKAAEILSKAGVQVSFDRMDLATHAKAFVIDNRYCFVGSHNFTHSAMAINKELSLFIDSPETAGKVLEFIAQIPRTPFSERPERKAKTSKESRPDERGLPSAER